MTIYINLSHFMDVFRMYIDRTRVQCEKKTKRKPPITVEEIFLARKRAFPGFGVYLAVGIILGFRRVVFALKRRSGDFVRATPAARK